MGGKSSTTTQSVQIPPEVLARYNAVNARAEQAAGTPFQPYSYNPADFVAQLSPTQLAGIQNINYAAGQAQPYYDEATGQLMGAQQAAVPYYGAAADIYGQAYGQAQPINQYSLQQLARAGQIGEELSGQALGSLDYGNYAAAPLQQQAAQMYGGAYGQAQPLNQLALQQYYSGLGAAQPLSEQAMANLAYGQAQGQQLTGGALSGLGAAQAAAYPYQQMATQYAATGAAPVSPGALNTPAYMSPYMQSVVAPTMALLNQQNQQAMAGQTANAIRAGAFGGDRAAIAAANLAQQQQLASGKVLGDLLQSGYGQALSTAQQQQQLGLTAEQANRAAQAAAGQQMLGIGQQGFGQALSTAQQQQAAAQQLFGLGATTAQQQAALAQQLYGQQLGVGQGVQGLAQQLYQQGLGTGQAQQSLAQQLFGQGATTAQQQAAIAQQLFGQGATQAQQQAAMAQQMYQQGMGLGQAQQGVGKELYGMGAATAQQLAALGQGAQAASLQGAQAQMGAGQAQQQTAQAGLQALYNQYLQQQGYPFQVAQFLANVAMGTGALSGSTTTTNQPGGLFSDARLKENIEEVGRTHDGQPIYKYNFKGSKKTEIGLLAQEVEKRHPEAVGQKAGFKTVDYDKATKRAGLGHVIDGEYTVREGGHVHPEHSGLGFSDGGMPYGMPGAGGLNIPTQMDGPKKLQTPGSPGAGKSVIGDIKDVADTAKAGKDLYDTGSKLASFMGFADGGMPYSDPNPTKLDIPDDKPEVNKLELPGAPPKGRTAMEDVKDIAAIAASIAAISDKRVKENIEEIGKLHDGQKVYRYNFKGDPEKHIGLIAQEVEQHHPKAVHEHNGLKMVDYDRATDVAAHAVRADGGRAGYADGGSTGLIDRADLAALLQAQAQMFGPYSQFNRPMGGAPGAGGVVPAGNLPVSGLAVAKGDLPRQSSMIEQAKQLGSVGEDALKAYNKGKEAGWWGKEKTNAFKGEEEYGDYKDPQIKVETPEFDVNPEDKLARGGLAGRRGYELGGDAENIYGIDTADTGGGLNPDEKEKSLASMIADPLYGFIDRKLGEMTGTPSGSKSTGSTGNWDYAPGVKPPAPAPVQGLAAKMTPEQAERQLQNWQKSKQIDSSNAGLAQGEERLARQANLFSDAPTITPELSANEQSALAAAASPEIKTPSFETPKSTGNKFMEWVKKPENFIPLATGVTGTILAPTRNPLVAAAYGLQSGVQAYQPTLKKTADIEQTQALGQGLRLQNAAVARGLGLQDAAGRQWAIFNDGTRMLMGEYLSLPPSRRKPLAGANVMSSIISQHPEWGVASSGAAAPEGQPSPGGMAAEQSESLSTQPAQSSFWVGKSALQSIENDVRRLNPMNPASRVPELETSKKLEANIVDDAQTAYNIGGVLNQLSDELLKLPSQGAASSGSFSEVRYKAMNIYNDFVQTIANKLGIDASEYKMSEKDLASAAAANKLNSMMAFARTNGVDQHSLGALQAAFSTVPGTGLSKPQAIEVMAGSYIDKQRAMDMQNALNEYKQKLTEMYPGMSDLYLTQSAMAAYRKDHPDSEYTSAKEGIKALMTTPFKGKTLWQALQAGEISPALAERFLREDPFKTGRKINAPNVGRFALNN